MRKAFLHIFFLSLLVNTALTHAAVVPHEALAGTSVQDGNPGKRFVVAENRDNSQLDKDLTITDWDDYEECDTKELTPSKGYATVSPERESRLVECHNYQSFKGKFYTSLNFSRLPRHNYISLRVLRI